MKIFPVCSYRSSAPVEIPLTADCFHAHPDYDSLIIDNPAVVEAFIAAVDCVPYDVLGEVTLDIDPWSDSVPCMNAEATEYSFAWFASDGLWIAEVALTDEEIDLVLLATYPELVKPELAEAYNEAVEIERWKSGKILENARRTHLNAF